ncbi:MAG TPA: HdeD family acid-resistance protein [Steroidobacteraceae bacterium]|nr:HdeD family acid-resistance protein [Steroidobacteraceae bacterium]
MERMQAAIAGTLKAHWRLFLTEGIILLILGFAAILIPPIATFAVEILIGWLLLMSGIVGLFTTFRMRHAPGFWWSLFSALLGVAAGIVLIGWPVSGAVSLTLILSLFLLFEGVASIMLALEHRQGFSARWAMLALSGVIDLILAGIIFSGLPGTAAWAIGLLVGINLVFGGSALISMALHARGSAPGAPSGASTSSP